MSHWACKRARGRACADHLVDMVMASVNRKACDPSVDAITTMCYERFRGITEAEAVNSELDSD